MLRGAVVLALVASALSAGRVAAEDEGAAAARAERVAVLPLLVEGLQKNEIDRLNDGVRARVVARVGLDVQDEATTNALVDSSQSLGLDCDLRDVACAARLGRIADVETVLAGSAVGMNGRVGLDLKLVDVGSGAVRRRTTALLPADPDRQEAALDEAVRIALDPAARAASLTLSVEPAGATILVDGIERGDSPLPAPLAGLVPGEHVVVVRKKGYLPVVRAVRLEVGAARVEALSLPADPETRPAPPSLVEQIAPWAIVGAGALVASGGVALGAAGAMPAFVFVDRQEQLARLDDDAPDYGARTAALHDESARAAAAWNRSGRFVLGGGLAATTIGIAAVVGGGTWGALVLRSAADAAAE